MIVTVNVCKKTLVILIYSRQVKYLYKCRNFSWKRTSFQNWILTKKPHNIGKIINNGTLKSLRKQILHQRHDTRYNDIQHNDTKHNNTEDNITVFSTLSITTLSIMTLSITTLSIMTLGIMTLGITTFSIMTFSITTLSITTFSKTTLGITLK